MKKFNHNKAWVELHTGNCLEIIPELNPNSIDLVVTSPPYNLGVKYEAYDDTICREEYLLFMWSFFDAIQPIMKPDASLFLNIGSKPTSPLGPFQVALEAAKVFKLQNVFYWIKSISIDENSHGHYKPINSDRFVNDTVELVLHLTKTGDVKLDRTAIGVPFMDKTNLSRGDRGKNGDLRCRGNAWYCPYETVSSEKAHPAAFPPRLAEMCLKIGNIQSGMTVLDPFMGSGSTGVAANKLGANFIGIELNKKDVEYAEGRIRNVS